MLTLKTEADNLEFVLLIYKSYLQVIKQVNYL